MNALRKGYPESGALGGLFRVSQLRNASDGFSKVRAVPPVAGSSAEAYTPLGTTRTQYFPPSWGAHTGTETMVAFTFNNARLISSLHRCALNLWSIA